MMEFWSWMQHAGLVIFILSDLLATGIAIKETRANRKEIKNTHSVVADLLNGHTNQEGKTCSRSGNTPKP